MFRSLFASSSARRAVAQAASSALPRVPVMEDLEGRRLFSSLTATEEGDRAAMHGPEQSDAALLDNSTFAESLDVEVTNGDYTVSTPGGGGGAPGSDGQNDSDKNYSEDPVRYYDGQLRLEAVDLLSDGFGERWGQSRGWVNDVSGTFYAERGWRTTELPSLIQLNSGNTIVTLDGSGSRRYFDFNGSSYIPRHFVKDRLTFDAANGEFVLTDTIGNQVCYMDFSTARPTAQRGLFKSFSDPRGNSIAVTTYNTDGRVAEVQRADVTAGVTESFVYSYVSGGANNGLLSGVTLRRQPGGGSWETVRAVEYRYYDGTTAHGNARDLETAIVKDASGATIDQHYYRYYKAGETGGYEHGLKLVFTPKSYARVAAAVGNVSTATDAQIAAYADYRFEYDALTHRVTRQDIARWGSSETAGGIGTYTYAYSENPAADPNSSAIDYNVWRFKTVETLPDGNQNIVYCNEAGQVMLKVYGETSSGKEWRTFWKYGGDGAHGDEGKPVGRHGARRKQN